MTNKEIHEKLIFQCTHQRALEEVIPDGLSPEFLERWRNFAWIDIPYRATEPAITRLIDNNLVFPPADFDFERIKKAHELVIEKGNNSAWFEIDPRGYHQKIASSLIKNSILTSYSAFEILLDDLMWRLSFENGGYCYCDINGGLIPFNSCDARICFNVSEENAFWFNALCGYKHYPSISPNWLVKRVHPAGLDEDTRLVFNELNDNIDGEFWYYHHRGSTCIEGGYAIVLDGIPIKSKCTEALYIDCFGSDRIGKNDINDKE